MESTQQISNIKLTDFAMRHFDPKFGGTKILNLEPSEMEEKINWALLYHYAPYDNPLTPPPHVVAIHDGYAPFCKLVAIQNTTDARVGCVPITESNYIYIRHGYSKRRDGEFETSSRWLELPVKAPKANYLMLVLYSKEQIDKEAIAEYNKKMADGDIDSIGLERPEPFDGDWGVVAILGQHGYEEEPMKPETFDRNYMPIEFGGSGMEFPTMPKKPNLPENSELMNKYKDEVLQYREKMDEIRATRKRSVDFWQNHVTVK